MNYNPYSLDFWDNDGIVHDEFDSDQLDEDESYSFASGLTQEQDCICAANWRGWKPSTNVSNQVNSKASFKDTQSEVQVPKLVDLSAKFIAHNLPFELVETYTQPIPEDLQLKITFASFPDNPDDIRLYSCLANGTAEEFSKGENLFLNKCVKGILQIGFHLSGSVIGQKLAAFNVAIVCDRKKITSCHCSCSKNNSWCSHIVAVCLSRIQEPQNVQLRAPVSESLSKLKRDQLQKFAQYLISELPQQILPTAQKLLDELLKGDGSNINTCGGAPDPTAGPSANDLSIWCLDENQLQDNIKRTLSKFIQPTPHVVSDVDYLAHSSSQASNEYTSLLRPLRGREPEAMWNLVSIVKEMFRNRDKNCIPLLKIMTDECVALDQMLHLWFMIKVSPLYTSSNQSASRNIQNQMPPAHQACASLLDEIVNLWRNLCLNPALKSNERAHFKDLLLSWQKVVYEKLKRFLTNGQDRTNLMCRLDLRYFPAFSVAINACQVDWSMFDFRSNNSFKSNCLDELHKKFDAKSSSICVSNEIEEVKLSPNQLDDETSIYLYDYEKLRSTMVKQKPRETLYHTENFDFDSIEVLFTRCEALYLHGLDEKAVILAKILSEYLLSNQSVNQTNDFQTSIVWRTSSICTILLDHFEYHNLAFRIGLYGLEATRQPAKSKALEVKLFNQEQELVNLLKRIQLSQIELDVLKDRAQKLKDLQLIKCKGDGLLPIMLASYIFEILCLNDYGRSNQADELLGFEAAITGLGLKTSLDETHYPLVCEGLRRQKGDLALTLLLTYKDDQVRLAKVMDRLLDKDTHVLFNTPINPFQPNLKKIQQNQTNPQTQKSIVLPQLRPAEIQPKVQPKYSTIDSLSSGWEESENECPTQNLNLLEAKVKCMNLKLSSNKKGSSLESSPPETTSSDNSPTLKRKATSKLASQSTISTNDEVKPVKESSARADTPDCECDKTQFLISRNDTQVWTDHTVIENMTTGCMFFDPLINNSVSTSVHRNRLPLKSRQGNIQVQPSEALAHFLFEFSRTVLSKAGGTVSTSIFLNQTSNGTHRNLHICAFLIALYALGLHNQVQTNWLNRTYSTHVSWINGQALEIGYSAICILIDCWEGRLTPTECAILADRASRGRDSALVRAASELALSSLKYANALNLQEIQRALIQCKEQSNQMLQKACLTVENAVRDGNNINLTDILFELARKWDDLYQDSLRNQSQINQTKSENQNNNQTLPQAAAVAAVAAVVTQQQQQQQQPFTFAVQAMPFIPAQFNQQNPLFMPPMYTAYGTIVPTPHHPIFTPPPQQIPQEISSECMSFLAAAFRVGMLAFEALPRRADSSQILKYLRCPPYADNVKWLWSIATKLGTNQLQQFCQTASNVIQNPFLIQDLAFDSANFICQSNPAQFANTLHLPMINVLIQKCLNAYSRCCMQRMHHLSPNDHEDFISMVVTARNAFYFSGNISYFSELLQNIRRSKACKKDLWLKLYNALAINSNTNSTNNF